MFTEDKDHYKPGKEAGLGISDTIKLESQRYKRKGYGLFFSIVFALSFFIGGPYLLKMVYPTEITNPGHFEYFSTLILYIIVYDAISLGYGLIYWLNWPFFEKYKVTNDPYPWNDPKVDWPVLFKYTLKMIAINHFIVLPIIMLESLVTNKSKYRYAYSEFPEISEIIIHIVFFMIMDDFSFYWSHRFLHWDKIYHYIHKTHHIYNNPLSFTNAFSHPLEYTFGNVVTAFAGPLILGKSTHLATIILWIVLRTAETHDGHSGYEFSWSPYRLIPFSGSAEFHHYHHLNFKGNYSSFFTFWDRINGTISDSFIRYANTNKDTNQQAKDKSS